LTIGKATATVTVTGGTYTYDGQAHGASGSVTGVGGVPLPGLDLGAKFTNVPGGTAHWTFAGGTNYEDASGDMAIVINKATATIVVTPYSVIYDGAPHTAMGTATGVEGESLSGLDLSGTTHTNVGSYATDGWTFTDATGNYNYASGKVSDSIGAWRTTGFYQPVDMSTPTTVVWNTVKGGSTVPLKFNVFADKRRRRACPTSKASI